MQAPSVVCLTNYHFRHHSLTQVKNFTNLEIFDILTTTNIFSGNLLLRRNGKISHSLPTRFNMKARYQVEV